MRFSLSLPPLVMLLLLAFLWLILAVLIFWFVFRPRRGAAEPEQKKQKRSRDKQDGFETMIEPASLKARTPTSSASPRAPTVRAVTSPKHDPEPEPRDEFDEFNRPGNRRDDFDF